MLAQLLENKRLPGSQKIPTLAEFSGRFFQWLDSLPTDRPPKGDPKVLPRWLETAGENHDGRAET